MLRTEARVEKEWVLGGFLAAKFLCPSKSWWLLMQPLYQTDAKQLPTACLLTCFTYPQSTTQAVPHTHTSDILIATAHLQRTPVRGHC